MLPELDVFDPHRYQFVCPERVALHHKDFVFVTPAGQRKTSVSLEQTSPCEDWENQADLCCPSSPEVKVQQRSSQCDNEEEFLVLQTGQDLDPGVLTWPSPASLLSSSPRSGWSGTHRFPPRLNSSHPLGQTETEGHIRVRSSGGFQVYQHLHEETK